MIVLDDGRMRVEVAPERGAEIRFAGRSGGDNVLAFYDWAAPQPAGAAPLGYGDPELDWLSGYRGGWQEVFPNAGAPCTVAGVPLPMHGEASIAPWEVLAADARSATLRVAARLPLVLERRMTLDPDRAALRIEETVTNESDLEMPFLLGHHPAFEALPGMQIDLPGARIEPTRSTPAGRRAGRRCATPPAAAGSRSRGTSRRCRTCGSGTRSAAPRCRSTGARGSSPSSR